MDGMIWRIKFRAINQNPSTILLCRNINDIGVTQPNGKSWEDNREKRLIFMLIQLS